MNNIDEPTKYFIIISTKLFIICSTTLFNTDEARKVFSSLLKHEENALIEEVHH